MFGAGLTSRQVSRWIAAGRLIRVYTGVYAVGHAPAHPLNRACAAVLACGPGALLCRESAGALWGWMERWPEVPQVCTERDRRPAGIAVRITSTLTAADRDRQRGIPITSPARTLLELAPSLTDRRLTRVYNEARRSRLLSEAAMQDVLQRRPGAPSGPRLRRLITGQNPTASGLEDEFSAFVARFGLPRPQRNVKVAGLEVDICYPEQRVIVEVDSWLYHGDRAAFERDRLRDSITTAAGFRTVRVTAERLDRAEADRLAAILGG